MPPDLHDFAAMGVRVRVGGAASSELAEVRELFDEWEQTFSRFRPSSELSRVNRRPYEVVVVSPLFARVTAVALAAAARTDGRVDPTLGAAIEAAGYDRDFAYLSPQAMTGDSPRTMAPADTSRALPHTGVWQRVRLQGPILSRPSGVAFDLNGVVKGMVVDEALALLGGDGFVAAGGDIAARGPLEVELPGGGSVRVRSSGIATSGSSNRRWHHRGELQHHLLDPSSGRPASSRWSDVTVVAATCLTADVAAKSAFLLSDDGPAWIDEIGLAGRFLAESGELVMTSDWPFDLAVAA
jgi:thiamine biosynthesis lipoprotein